MKKLVIIDGQGGRLGQMIVEGLKKECLDAELYAIGTNSAATLAMIRAGADYGATGENPVLVACRDADYIVGPIGIVAADALLGEITPKMVVAIGQSPALKLLLPVSHCNNQVIGVKDQTMSEMVKETVETLRNLLAGKGMP